MVMSITNITNITLTQSVIKTSISSLILSDSAITNVINPNNNIQTFISCSTDSLIHVNGLNYSQSQASLMLLNNVTGVVDRLNVESVDSISDMIQIDDSYDLKLHTLSISNVSSQAGSIVLIKDSAAIEMDNVTISDVYQLVIETSNSQKTRAHNLSMINCDQGIKITDHSDFQLNSSTFQNVGNSDVVYGGAIHSTDSILIIDDSVFDHCQARQGG